MLLESGEGKTSRLEPGGYDHLRPILPPAPDPLRLRSPAGRFNPPAGKS